MCFVGNAVERIQTLAGLGLIEIILAHQIHDGLGFQHHRQAVVLARATLGLLQCLELLALGGVVLALQLGIERFAGSHEILEGGHQGRVQLLALGELVVFVVLAIVVVVRVLADRHQCLQRLLVVPSSSIEFGQHWLGSHRLGHGGIALLHVVIADLERTVHLCLATGRAGGDILDPARIGLDAAVGLRIKRVEAADVGVELGGQLLLRVGRRRAGIRRAGGSGAARSGKCLATAGGQDQRQRSGQRRDGKSA